MIRSELPDGWRLIAHPEHARLAGQFARRWKNQQFAPPDPFPHVLDACYHHDDSWGPRDAEPFLTPEGLPSAFSRELVGTYDAFEEIDLPGYLKVREQATEDAAERDPYSAILISMHTLNLLTEQADLSGLDDESLRIHGAFVEGQVRRQGQLRQSLAKVAHLGPHLTDRSLRRGFEFLQACDSFSLYACSDFPETGKLRHAHPMNGGGSAEISIIPLGDLTWRLDPYPLDEPDVTFELRFKDIRQKTFASQDEFRARYRDAPVSSVAIRVVK